MIFDGFWLMLIGMTTVFTFLALLAFLVSLFPLVFRMPKEKLADPSAPIPAIVAAAVNYYYLRRNRKKL